MLQNVAFDQGLHCLQQIHSDKKSKMAPYGSPDYQTSFTSIGLSVQEINTDIQDGSHGAILDF